MYKTASRCHYANAWRERSAQKHEKVNNCERDKFTYTRVTRLGILKLTVLVLILVNSRIIARIHRGVVVSEEKPRRIGLVNIVVEINSSAGDRQRVSVQAVY